MTTLSPAIHDLATRIERLRESAADGRRRVVALAGVPGSGKSTISATLIEHLKGKSVRDVAVVPMDGFHYTKEALSKFDDPEAAFRRRGAPFTFDAEAFVAAVQRIRAVRITPTPDPAQDIHLPGFDHAVQDPTADQIRVQSDIKVVILEGNYLLLDEEPWNKIAPMYNEKWFVRVPRAVAKARLIKRHLFAGIEQSPETAEARAEANDMQNADLITSSMIAPDVIING